MCLGKYRKLTKTEKKSKKEEKLVLIEIRINRFSSTFFFWVVLMNLTNDSNLLIYLTWSNRFNFLFVLIQRFYLKSARQLKRLESVSRSPIYSLFGESLNGISTIRAFRAEKRFISQMQNYLNDNVTIYLYDMTANR